MTVSNPFNCKRREMARFYYDMQPTGFGTVKPRCIYTLYIQEQNPAQLTNNGIDRPATLARLRHEETYSSLDRSVSEALEVRVLE